ncbi:response regulator [Bradyrhizobium sp. AUGA SZCCT0240]|jgi:signal transduction histidine kinase|uniref:ATP-binding protein n=1 Tax=unclassified Bradyrhizobium TaxID=2631580 RepID=UPI001BACF73B|nr:MULTISPECIES: ATP-binding protein [unclassified Bradyrhizobium]MBR1190239.1 response regulator [Bradyrhizobium sp. AUGA SZCCT0160]MBR1196743.1 response regulator [Bradyrhizobium sp. AUGA SZCCT0158]MBR1241392.1 response regulator [Bradyrhizobium sp. AUGA SZCCT0274]MBR1250220.1 response regulator [Bradyrhizobium sp. AUGA SZCCT0169]MBR1252727.1 response regulator [Bradyrhizobium sp. AUGA SZCCT0240]
MSTLTPHGACLLWKPELIWLNAVSDAMLASAFFATAFVLGFFVWRRRDVMFRGVFWTFAVFAAVCGVTRLLSILTLWVPAYGIEAFTKGFLALISVVITAALLLMLPRILVLPTRRQLQQANAALEEEIRQRRKAEAMVKRFQEIEASEAQVRQAQKMEAIGQLTGGVAHDFNNILTVITGTIEILGEAVKDRPHLGQITDMISAAAARGADLTRHLLAFARRQPLQPRNTDVNVLVIDAVRLLRPTLSEQIEIESMLVHDSAPALIDPSQLSTAILNLALNARDAMPNGGKLTLETKNVVLDENYASMNSEVNPGNYVMIAVSDTGAGIPGSLLDKVFEPFFTTKEVGKGSGLGLSMVYGFVKQSNGHIKIYSEEGHGTTVKLYLPQAAGITDALAAETGIPGVEHGDESILIVEDDALVREYVVAQISRFGYHTQAAGNGAEALAIIDHPGRIDLLFTDVIIPGGLNGRQLATEALKRRPGLKVLYTSGYTENAIVHHGRLDAGVLLLPKPYLSSDLARMIRTALAS